MYTKISARYVLGFDGKRHTLVEDGEVVFEGDVIVFVGRGYSGPVDEERDYGKSLVMPGLIDLDALADIDHLILDSWPSPDVAAGHLWSEDYFANRRRDVFSRAERAQVREFALAQLALHGITTYMPIASEIHSSWAEGLDELVDMAGTSRRIGLRGYLGPAYRSGVHVTTDAGGREVHFDEARGVAGLQDAQDFLDYAVDLADPLITGVLLPCRIETLSENLMRETARIARDRDALVRLHCLQSPLEDGLLQRSAGRGVLELLESTGLFGTRLLIPHGVVIDAKDPAAAGPGGPLDLLARHGVSIVHCPLTSFRYQKQLVSFDRFREAGVNLCLGTDSFPPDLVRGIDAGMHLTRLVEERPGAGALTDYFDAATLGGAKALGRPDLGRLAPGMQADITVVSLGHFADGVVEDPLRTLVLNGTARQVTDTFVAGRPVVVEGALPGVDLAALRAEGQRLFDQMKAAYGERDHRRREADELFPPAYPQADIVTPAAVS
ncbi:cytosine/adenosine deaminase-related metal-dependent hydrolase [Arthrobacter sp. SLBN-100]|uniref:amidohydrolase family protein n=1 Tax=Arthrobacter sp. SLBN-100 TaxID=2768450 RepID=UPI00114F47E0|nr:amidohydrolase family protein [Arthrobacter sp. SLBN-100]TQJ68107.1 cytosine/adenosine deaminase-related metal-dependent hydrolase [Arthrobacter sp. SLBN-100]